MDEALAPEREIKGAGQGVHFRAALRKMNQREAAALAKKPMRHLKKPSEREAQLMAGDGLFFIPRKAPAPHGAVGRIRKIASNGQRV